ncbi:hypothetical protein BGW42_008145 [Actinomortierella wolfii]|nr:hypothetical protein BGW42_008145 [Actinomortierella wolfii]
MAVISLIEANDPQTQAKIEQIAHKKDSKAANKFDQMGANQCQALQVEAILSLSLPVIQFWFYCVMMNDNREQQLKYQQEYYEKRVPTWLSHLEKIAERNGSNGYLVGEKFTLADAKFVGFLDILLSLDTDAFLTKEAYPALFKVKQTVDTHPRYAEYRKSDTFALLSTRGEEVFRRYHLDFNHAKANLY